jgi:hypothetical protein
VPRFRVTFDGEWQGEFHDLAEALEYAEEAAATGRMTWVIERRLWGVRNRLCATFPQEQHDRAEKLWRAANRFQGIPAVPPRCDSLLGRVVKQPLADGVLADRDWVRLVRAA